MSTSSGRSRLVASALTITLGASLVAGISSPTVHATSIAPSTLNLNGQGSTFIQPLMARWAFVYHNTVNKETAINYQGTGSGAGVSAFTSGLVDFAGTDAFMTDDQIKAAGGDVLHIPLAIGPVALTYNLPGFKANLKLDGPTLAAIYAGKITSWNDKAIAALNPGVPLPGTAVVVAHRSDGSGTSFIFTNYLTAVDANWKANVGAGTTVAWPTGQGAKGTAGVAQVVHNTPGGIGYVELSYALQQSLPVIAIKNAAGQFIVPTTAGAAADAASFPNLPTDLRALIVNGSGKTAYPITGFSWVVIHQHAKDNVKSYGLLKFLWWTVTVGQTYSSSGQLRYATLPASIVKLDEAKIASVTYNGKPVYQG
jgi:phosphate transport system substrate-binding protein